ncbi:uncharacterized protein [Panulirus ornatus]|uniref:uncharacterized protein isoform X2 n=1 Tax=Panulirus ornatus TaxID=150431 RepID=UPI003A8662AD
MSTTFPPEAIDLLLELNTSSVPSCSSMYNATDQNTQIKFYSVILPVIIAFTVSTCVVSGAVVCSAPWVKRPMSPTIRLSLSLAAANTLFSVTWLLCLVVNMYLPTVQGMFSIPICVRLSLEVLRLGSILLQILHLLVVALNHYIGIIRPLHYAAIVTSTTLKAILAVLWLSPLVGMFVAFSSIPGQGFQSFGCRTNYFYECGVTFRLVWTSIFFGPTLVIIVVYCHIFHLLNNRSLYLVSTEQQTQLRKNIKTVRTTALIVGTFVVGWGPAVVKFLLVCSDCVIQELDLHTNMYLGAAFNTLFSLKVFTDTFIYAIRLPDIRKALMTMWMLFRNRLRMRRRGLREGSARSSSRTTSTRLSLSSPSIHRFRSSLSHGSPSSRSGSRSRSASPALQNTQVRRLTSLSPLGSRRSPVNVEVTAYTNSLSDDIRLKTLVEETPLDPILEVDIDHV